VPGEVRGGQQRVQCIGRGHLLLQPVYAGFDAGGVGRGGEQGDEGAAGLDDALLDEGRGDVGAGVAGGDLHERFAAAGAGVLRGFLLDVHVRGHPAVALDTADAEPAEDEQHQQDGQNAAEESAAALGGTAPAVAGRLIILRVGEIVERDIVVVAHRSSSWLVPSVGGSSTSSPARAPVARSVSSVCWRIITAATWSTTWRCLRPFRPERCSA